MQLIPVVVLIFRIENKNLREKHALTQSVLLGNRRNRNDSTPLIDVQATAQYVLNLRKHAWKNEAGTDGIGISTVQPSLLQN